MATALGLLHFSVLPRFATISVYFNFEKAIQFLVFKKKKRRKNGVSKLKRRKEPQSGLGDMKVVPRFYRQFGGKGTTGDPCEPNLYKPQRRFWLSRKFL